MATMRVMQRRSPVELTLAHVAKEAGVVPATLIQRFGTKRTLLLATCKAGTADVAANFASFPAPPESMANGLAYLQIDLMDPEFHALTLAQFVAMRDQIKKLLD